MKKVFLFSLVVLLSCKINAADSGVAPKQDCNQAKNWTAHEKCSTDPGVKVS